MQGMRAALAITVATTNEAELVAAASGAGATLTPRGSGRFVAIAPSIEIDALRRALASIPHEEGRSGDAPSDAQAAPLELEAWRVLEAARTGGTSRIIVPPRRFGAAVLFGRPPPKWLLPVSVAVLVALVVAAWMTRRPSDARLGVEQHAKQDGADRAIELRVAAPLWAAGVALIVDAHGSLLADPKPLTRDKGALVATVHASSLAPHLDSAYVLVLVGEATSIGEVVAQARDASPRATIARFTDVVRAHARSRNVILAVAPLAADSPD